MNFQEIIKQHVKDNNPLEYLKKYMHVQNIDTEGIESINLEDERIVNFFKNSIYILKQMYSYENYEFKNEYEQLNKLSKLRKYKPTKLLNEIIAEHYKWSHTESSEFAIKNIYVNRTCENIIEDINILLEFNNGQSTTITLEKPLSKYIGHSSRIKKDIIELAIIDELVVSKYTYAYYFDIVPQDFDKYDIYDLLTLLNSINY